METDGRGLISPTMEVSVVEGELVATIRELASRGVGIRVIARTVGSRATRYGGISAGRWSPACRPGRRPAD